MKKELLPRIILVTEDNIEEIIKIVDEEIIEQLIYLTDPSENQEALNQLEEARWKIKPIIGTII